MKMQGLKVEFYKDIIFLQSESDIEVSPSSSNWRSPSALPNHTDAFIQYKESKIFVS